MGIIGALIQNLTPIFLITSPLTSYADQILSIHRTRTSAGFSLDIPLIMLSASILKIFYWPGTRFDSSLLIQAIVMVGVQTVLLKVALDNRPSWRDGGAGGGLLLGEKGVDGKGGVVEAGGGSWMPGGFWRWRAQKPYWQFLLTLTLSLLTLHFLLQPTLTTSTTYTSLLGAVALTIEATLPLPQLYSNWASHSCKGFRVSVLANWLVGDAMKMSYFFLQGNDSVTWPFKACGVFQALCDVGLGVQYAMYGDGPAAREVGESMGIRMDEARGWEKGGS